MKPQLWTVQPVEKTVQVYRDWAETYDADVSARGYHTPARIAQALELIKDQIRGPILDFGCGTGLSGVTLAKAGFLRLHGTDISAEMLQKAEEKQVYEKLWLSQPGECPAKPGTYDLIVAAGVISLGAAPPETLATVLSALDRGAYLALSFNDPTLVSGLYDKALDEEVKANRVAVIFRQHGPHLDDMGMGSDILILQRK